MTQSDKRKNMIKIAKLYYYGHMTQEQIAQMMGMSRSKVTRLLMEAEQYGIVQITVHDPTFNYERAAEILKEHFQLKIVTIVPSSGSAREVKDTIGKTASRFLNEHLFDSIKIGISWGTTVGAFVGRFQTNKSLPKAWVVQMVGGTYSQSMHMDGQELAKGLAMRLKCSFSALQAPMFVHNPELRNLIMEEPETIAHFRLISNLDIAFVGIGSSNYKESVIFKAGYIEENEARRLYSTGVCDICGHQIDINGREQDQDLAAHLIGISLEDLARIPLVIGMCAGSDRTASILSGIHGKYLKGLIIDEIAAISLLQAEGLEL